jgi:predicted sulfurtransferase
MSKIILFYKYIDIQYPEQIQKWQMRLCQELGLRGRIILAHEGINATVGGSDEAIQSYKQAMENHELFGGIDFKESEGGAQNFPRLRIVVKKEIVRLDLDPTQVSAKDGGVHLTPAQVHQLLTEKPEDLLILDGRNLYEAEIGAFKDAIKPEINTFREFPTYVDTNLEQFKDKQVLMYCTGGIRCERASSYLKSKKVTKQVYQLSGGIHRYIEQFPEGFFRGKNYVFDSRISVKANDDVVSVCLICSIPCNEYTNCFNAACNKQFVACAPCLVTLNNCCKPACFELVRENKVPLRNHRQQRRKQSPTACSL